MTEYLFHGERVYIVRAESVAGRTVYITENAAGEQFRCGDHVLVPVVDQPPDKPMRSIAAMMERWARQPTKQKRVLR